MSKSILAWHFLHSHKKLAYPPHTEVRVGKTLHCDPAKLEMCEYGLHASVRPLAALQYLN